MIPLHDSRKIFLIDNEPRCVLAAYDYGDNAPTKEFKTYDKNVEVGDYVIVQTDTRHGMAVCQIKEVDVEVDLETSEVMRWVISIVDTSLSEKVNEFEGKLLADARAAEKIERKAKFKETFMKGVDAGMTLQLESDVTDAPEDPDE